MTEENPAHGYLWSRLASLDDFHSGEALDASIDPLVAAGVLDSEDPVIAEVRAVAAGLFRGAGTTQQARAPVPEPWRSMLARRGQGGGPEGLVVVGATTPPFDGITLAVLALHSSDEGFGADVEAVQAPSHWDTHRSPLDQRMLAWWAADDCGHHYLGSTGQWYSSDERSGGQIEFWPALDPAARVLDIMPTTTTARAVIRVPLAWGEYR